VELGLFTAMSLVLSGDVVAKCCCHGSLSAAWFIGRAICVARKQKADIVDALVCMILSRVASADSFSPTDLRNPRHEEALLGQSHQH
jgi:DUF917 family protein